MKKLILFLIIFISYTNSFSQVRKKMIIAISDTANYRRDIVEFNKKHDLIDLTKNNDSLFIRVTTSSIGSINYIYELKLNKFGWKARQISYGEFEVINFNLNFILLSKSYQFYTKKTKKLFVFRQRSLMPNDTTYIKFSWDSLETVIKGLNILNLKTQNEVDTSEYATLDGTSMDIEIASPNVYKYLSWSNPKSASKSFDSMAIQELYELISKKLYSKNNRWFSYSKKRWHK